jgi:hypothetical protein
MEVLPKPALEPFSCTFYSKDKKIMCTKAGGRHANKKSVKCLYFKVLAVHLTLKSWIVFKNT